jgi:secreted PhoX family phosphatase
MINHENTPVGGVSNLKINFNSTSKLWNTTNSKAVSVVAADIVKFFKNCSGAVTPWGTILSAEEARDTGDINSDGYQDVGWLVECDPVANSICKYNGGNKQQKLWAMGRMAHENACIAKDNKTVYYGEDATNGCVYKYVATTANNLSAGNLYVLKLSAALSSGTPTTTTGTWIQVPNTTQSQRNNIYSTVIGLGATTFNGVEDVEIGPDTMIYFASKGFGRIYRFKDTGTGISNFTTFVGGMNYSITNGSGVTTTAWGLGNDNLAFDGEGNLWVFQDGGNNYIWVVKKGHTQASPKVQIFGCAPTGAEPTGITFSPDNRFMFMSIQHPSTTNKSVMKDATGNNVVFNASATLVVGLKQDLGSDQTKISREITSIDFDHLLQAYPNPFINSTTLELMVLNRGALSLEIYNINGQLVGNSIDEDIEEGIWNREIGAELPSGFYFVRASINQQVHTLKFIKE